MTHEIEREINQDGQDGTVRDGIVQDQSNHPFNVQRELLRGCAARHFQGLPPAVHITASDDFSLGDGMTEYCISLASILRRPPSGFCEECIAALTAAGLGPVHVRADRLYFPLAGNVSSDELLQALTDRWHILSHATGAETCRASVPPPAALPQSSWPRLYVAAEIQRSLGSVLCRTAPGRSPAEIVRGLHGAVAGSLEGETPWEAALQQWLSEEIQTRSIDRTIYWLTPPGLLGKKASGQLPALYGAGLHRVVAPERHWLFLGPGQRRALVAACEKALNTPGSSAALLWYLVSETPGEDLDFTVPFVGEADNIVWFATTISERLQRWAGPTLEGKGAEDSSPEGVPESPAENRELGSHWSGLQRELFVRLFFLADALAGAPRGDVLEYAVLLRFAVQRANFLCNQLALGKVPATAALRKMCAFASTLFSDMIALGNDAGIS